MINITKSERGDPSVWKEVYELGRQIAADFDIEPSTTTGRQQHRVNVPATNPESYWQRALCLPLIDHLIQEMNDSQALITGGSLPWPLSAPNKTARIKQVRPR